MRVAAIDLGTNTFLCLIADVEGAPGAARILRVVSDVARVVRLGEGVHQNRRFSVGALERARVCLDEFREVIHKFKVEKVFATATSAARDVSNGEDLMRLGRDRGIPISIIAGDREADLSFQGAVSALSEADEKSIAVIDVGGGSTELIYKDVNGASRRTSFDVGCVRLTEMFFKSDPPHSEEIKQAYEFALKTMKPFGRSNADLVVAVAGTPTTLACIAQGIEFDDSKVEGFRFTLSDLAKVTESLARQTLVERKNVKGLDPLRADVIVMGGLLLQASLEVLGKDEIYVSTRGLRYGGALNYESFS